MWQGKRTAAFTIALLLLLGGCGTEETQSGETILTGVEAEEAASYTTYEVVPVDVAKNGSMALTVMYTQLEPLYPPEDQLFFGELLVSRGETVKKGEPIATFQRQSSKAELQKAQLELERLKQEREDRLEELYEQLETAWAYSDGIGMELAQIEYDRADCSFQRQIDLMQEEVDDRQAAFEPLELLAPYDCVVENTTFFYDQQEVDTSTVIVEVSNVASMVLLGEDITNSFQYGSEVQVEYGRAGKKETLEARVVCTSAILGNEGREVYILPNEPVEASKLEKPVAKADCVQLKDALTVPRAAVKTENGNDYVQILIDGVTHKRYVICGALVGNTTDRYIVVLSGLEAGQQVIIE